MSRKLLNENVMDGLHVEKTHNKSDTIACLDSCCTTRLQTPHPANAIQILATPLTNEAAREIIACVLKSIERMKLTFLTCVNDIITTDKASTLNRTTRLSFSRNLEMDGAEK